MTARGLIVIGLLVVVLGRVACDWRRINILKRFALGNGLTESRTNLWWNNKALLGIETKLPEGPIRTKVRMLRAGTWVFWLGHVIVAFIILHHIASISTR